ncbi:glycosyltransferase [Lactococcus cremoris]|nr:glycosyltransferase [Lactococcus cremoris]MCD6632979.1 glycosyltransferase [Lactococcus cremoris]
MSIIGVFGFLIYGSNRLIVSLTYLIGGEFAVPQLFPFRFLIALFTLLCCGLAYYVSTKKRLIYNLATLIASLWFVTLPIIIFQFLFKLLIEHQGFDFSIVSNMDIRYLIVPFMPIMYLSFCKFTGIDVKQLGKNIKSTVYVLLVIYLVALVVYSGTQINITFNFAQEGFFNSIELNYSAFLAHWIEGLTVVSQFVLPIIAFALVIGYKGEKSKRKIFSLKPIYVLILVALGVYAYIFLLDAPSNFIQFNEKIFNSYFALQVFEVGVIMLLTIYTGLKKFIRPRTKILLYIGSSLPFLYLYIVRYHYWKQSYLVIDVFDRINYIFFIFSVFVFLYYTVEVIILWYSYNKRQRVNALDLRTDGIQKQFHIYVLIPCLNEELVIQTTLRSILKNNYKNLVVTVIDDASDDRSLEKISEINDSRLNVLRRIKPNAQKGKGTALNWAYYQISEQIQAKGIAPEEVLIAIIDADTKLETDYFEKVNRAFNYDDKLTGLQSKVRVANLLKDSSQDLEFSEIINATQMFRTLTNTVAFGGNGQFCKLSTLQALNEEPWTDSLVEDFDLSTRLFLSDIEVKNAQYDDIYIEQTGIINDNEALVKQRVRWAQGNIQSSKYIVPTIRSKNLVWKQKFEILMTLFKPWLMGIEYIIVIYTMIMIINSAILTGITQSLKIVVILFIVMSIYIIIVNFVWALLYNRGKNNEKMKAWDVLKDTANLTKFLLILTQIYPQSAIRFFNSKNDWVKTNRQEESIDKNLNEDKK